MFICLPELQMLQMLVFLVGVSEFCLLRHHHQALSQMGGVLLCSIFHLVRHIICQMEVCLCCGVLISSYLLQIVVDPGCFEIGQSLCLQTVRPLIFYRRLLSPLVFLVVGMEEVYEEVGD